MLRLLVWSWLTLTSSIGGWVIGIKIGDVIADILDRRRP